MANVLNYTEQGGDKTVIGGEIFIKGKMTVDDGAIVTGVIPVADTTTLGGVKVGNGLSTNAAGVLSVAPAAAQADSEAETLATLVSDFNALLTKLRTAGFISAE